jgi:hypothetical protein
MLARDAYHEGFDAVSERCSLPLHLPSSIRDQDDTHPAPAFIFATAV